jgi:hypothetical protein
LENLFFTSIWEIFFFSNLENLFFFSIGKFFFYFFSKKKSLNIVTLMDSNFFFF